jgi:rhodanese-related sulfurtransferase
LSQKSKQQNRRPGGGQSRRTPAPEPARILGLPRFVAAGLAAVVLVAVLAVAAVAGLGLIGGGSSGGGANTSPSYAIVQGNGGHWTNVSADQLAQMLTHKDFTLLNVKTPYIGEIAGTDLYIPYDQLAARQSELPASKSAKILVYCRSGVESVQAAQTLLSLGYTNVWNLDGGMNAWQQSGRGLVNLNRS